VFATSLVRDDGFRVGMLDYVTAAKLGEAKGARTFSDTDAAALVRDPRMEFAAPAIPPTG
jgi:hypothetical protein